MFFVKNMLSINIYLLLLHHVAALMQGGTHCAYEQANNRADSRTAIFCVNKASNLRGLSGGKYGRYVYHSVTYMHCGATAVEIELGSVCFPKAHFIKHIYFLA